MLAAALAGWLGRPVPEVAWPVPATPIVIESAKLLPEKK